MNGLLNFTAHLFLLIHRIHIPRKGFSKDHKIFSFLYFKIKMNILFPNSTIAYSASSWPIFIDWLFPKIYRFHENINFVNFRHTLYLISPWESTFFSIDQVPNYNIQVATWWFIFIIIEFLLLSLSGHSDRFALNDSITSISAGILSQGFKFGGRTIACFGYIYIWENFRFLELPWNSYWTWTLCFLTQDFAYYLGHRAIHEIGVFWGMHTIHHSSQYFNFSTSLRQAAIQDAGLAFYDVMQAFFIPPPIFLVHRYFSEIFQFWMHTSLLGSLGPFGWLFNTPSHHRVHHGCNQYCIDRNFGGVLIIWDRLFGTFEAERLSDPPICWLTLVFYYCHLFTDGLIKNERCFNQIWLQFHTFKEFLLDKWRERDVKGRPIFPHTMDKLKAIFFPPAWYPGMPVRLFFHWATLRCPLHLNGVHHYEHPTRIYNPHLSTWLKAYILCHFILLLAFVFHFEYDRAEMRWPEFILKMAFYIFTMQSFGAFFDLRHWATSAELFRCASATIYYYAIIIFDGPRPYRFFESLIFAISALFWTSRLCLQIFHGWKESRRKIRDSRDEEEGFANRSFIIF